MNPVLLSLLGHSYVAIAEEMGVNLYRAAQSTIIREVRDLATALLDMDGNAVAMGNFTPMLLNALEPAAKALRERFDFRDLLPDEGLVTNDPFRGGQHVNDIMLFTPIFFENEVVGLAGANAHHIDVGGASAATYAYATEVFQEGIVFPPMKVVLGEDWESEIIGQMLAANVRAPDKTLPDFGAQLAACRTGERRVQEMYAKYGRDTMETFQREILAYSEKLVRQAVIAVPDGRYASESTLEDDGVGGGPFTITVSVTVEGPSVTVDFEGTAEQASGFVNVPLASTTATTRTTLLSILGVDPQLVNAGAFRPIEVDVPLGSILNPRRPAATRARALTCYRIFDAINQALAPAVPELVTAPGFDCQTTFSFSRRVGSGFEILTEVMGAGLGAVHNRDGVDGMMMMLTNAMNTPIEAVEAEFPFLEVLRYGLIEGSGGAGTFSGGEGLERVYRILADGVVFGLYSDRYQAGAPGLFGGGPGAPGECWVDRNGERLTLQSKSQFDLEAGDVITIRSGGGGGFGAPS